VARRTAAAEALITEARAVATLHFPAESDGGVRRE